MSLTNVFLCTIIAISFFQCKSYKSEIRVLNKIIKENNETCLYSMYGYCYSVVNYSCYYAECSDYSIEQMQEKICDPVEE